MNSPLGWIAIFISLGIWVSTFIQIPILFIVSAAAFFILISLVMIKRKTASFASLSITFFFIGFLLFQIKQVYPANHINNFTSDEPESIYLEGLIIDEPQLTKASYGMPQANFILKASGFQKSGIKQEVVGKVKVFISEGNEQLNYGNRILINGLLSRPREPGNPGEFNYAQYLKREGISSILNAKGYNVILLEKEGGNSIARAAYSVRNRIKGIIDFGLPQDSADFLNAILLGQRQDVDFELNDIFMKTGTVHLLAISGLNVGLLVFLVMLIFRIVRIPRKVSVVATISFLVFYAILTSGRPSVIRATIMAIVILFGWLIGRESPMWNSLGLAAIIILGLEPNAIFDIGFQLSFISVASILYITPKIEKMFYYDRKLSVPFMSKCRRYFIEGAFVSAAAWLGVLPFVLYHFNIVTPIAILANLFAVPLSFLITASSIPFIIFSTFIPFIGKIFAGTTWLFYITLCGVTNILSKVPLAYLYLPKPSLFFIFVYYIFVVALVEYKRFKISISKIVFVGLMLINVIIWHSALKPNDGKLKVTFLDVGHGDSIFIEFPKGGNMLIDGGKGADPDEGRNVILPFLRNKGIQAIDAVVSTHPDADHVGGLASVIKGLSTRQVFESGLTAKNDAYLNFEDAVIRKKIKRDILKRSDSIEGAKVVDIICLNPPAEWAGDSGITYNDNSLVIKIDYKDIDLLFCADIEEKAIKDLLRYGQMLDAKFIKLPHHGEKLSLAGQAFIEKVKPKYAIISQGKASKEILNSKETEESLLVRGIKVFRTNRDGAVFVVTDGKSILIDVFKRD